MSATFVHRILKLAKYYPGKDRLVRELNEDDYNRGTVVCEFMSNFILENSIIFYNICSSDEYTLTFNGVI